MKKKWLSRVLATVLASVMAAGMLTACGTNDKQTSNESTPATSEQTTTQSSEATSESVEVVEDVTYPVDTDVTLSFYIQSNSNLPKSSKYTDYNDVPFYIGLEEKTGIDLDIQTFAEGADANVAYNLLLQEEKLPNIIFHRKCENVVQLYEDGLIYDLTDYLEKYAPDFWEYINLPENEANRKAITNDGKYLFIPTMSESDFNITYLGPVIRQDWLDECGLEVPVTLEDWENVLTVFKEKYGAYYSFPFSRTSVGNPSGGVGAFAGFSINYYVEDGQVKCANTQEEWKEFLTIMNRWYKNGLMDPDFATATDATVRTRAINGETGFSFTAMSQLTKFVADAEAENNGAKWVGLSYPRTEAGAPTTYIQTRSQTFTPWIGAVVTTSSTEEELIAAVKFLNYGFTEEGIIYWNFGNEGETYEVAADGSYQFTELITGDERGIAESLKDYTGASVAGITMQMADMVKAKNSQASVDAVTTWTENTVASQYVCPPYLRNTEETEIYSNLHTPIATYVSEMALKFVTGDESLDNFDAFVAKLEEMGLNELLKSEQAAYERFMNK